MNFNVIAIYALGCTKHISRLGKFIPHDIPNLIVEIVMSAIWVEL